MPGKIARYAPAVLRSSATKEVGHYRTADWRARRMRILIRDAYRCRACSKVAYGVKAHVDHIVPLESGGTDDDANLQVLCINCHGVKTREEQRRRGIL